jgi:hypothetical protein
VRLRGRGVCRCRRCVRYTDAALPRDVAGGGVRGVEPLRGAGAGWTVYAQGALRRASQRRVPDATSDDREAHRRTDASRRAARDRRHGLAWRRLDHGYALSGGQHLDGTRLRAHAACVFRRFDAPAECSTGIRVLRRRQAPPARCSGVSAGAPARQERADRHHSSTGAPAAREAGGSPKQPRGDPDDNPAKHAVWHTRGGDARAAVGMDADVRPPPRLTGGRRTLSAPAALSTPGRRSSSPARR